MLLQDREARVGQGTVSGDRRWPSIPEVFGRKKQMILKNNHIGVTLYTPLSADLNVVLLVISYPCHLLGTRALPGETDTSFTKRLLPATTHS